MCWVGQQSVEIVVISSWCARGWSQAAAPWATILHSLAACLRLSGLNQHHRSKMMM